MNCTNPTPKIKAPETADENTNTMDIDSIWVQSDFDSAVAVILNGDPRIRINLFSMDTLTSKSGKRTLTKSQLQVITNSLSGKVQNNYEPNDCFQPYHGFLFYKNGKIKARVAICFSCKSMYSEPLKSGHLNFNEIKQMFASWNLPTYDWDDSQETMKSKVKYEDYFDK